MLLSERSVLIVGNGPHARAYARIFREELKFRFGVAGRNTTNVEQFRVDEGAEHAFTLNQLTAQTIGEFDFVVVTTSPDSLETVTSGLIALGAKAILIEKPVALTLAGVENIRALAQSHSVFCRVAYNRRYYKSVRALKAILATQAPVQAFFDFTERSVGITSVDRVRATKEHWALVNSCHVFDTVRFLLGDYAPLHAYYGGEGALDWHPASSSFLGSGTCGTTPVSYSANWLCPGRWNIEVMTEGGRYKLSPMERLQVMRRNSFAWEEIDAGYEIDVNFKPGLHDMVLAFDAARLAASDEKRAAFCDLPTLAQNQALFAMISRLVGY